MAKTTPLLLLAALAVTAMAEPEATRGRILDREGRVLAETVDGFRKYPYESLACHALGYVGKIRAGDAKNVEGRDGVEKTGEETLKAGRDVMLTLDLEMQFAAETVLRESAIGRGAVVVIDPTNGDVIAMASVPSYDLNIWVPSITQEAFTKLQKDATLPLLNRAARAQYPPGSVFKTVSSLAFEGADQKRQCTGSVKIGERSFRCWKRDGHGELGNGEALVHSCNCYFYGAAQETGLDKISALGTQFGFGQRTGIELIDEDGFMPTSAEIEKRYGNKSEAEDTALLSVGQGYAMATPLQLAVAAAVFANEGKRVAPRLFLDREAVDPVVVEGVDPARLKLVREAMRKVVADPEGTGHRANSDRISIAGKTGTAQWKRGSEPQYVGQFMGFAPFDEPRYAIAVSVEHAKAGGRVCAPLAKKILERFAATDAGEKIEVKPLAPAKGHEELVDLVE